MLKEEEASEQESEAFRWAVLKKSSVLIVRTVIYIAGIFIKEQQVEVSIIVLASFLAFFVVSESICWYRFSRRENRR